MYNKTTLPNGIRVVTEYVPYVKSVSLGVWVNAGSRHEHEENLGIAHFLEHMLFKGTFNRTAREIAESVDSIGGQLNAFTAKEHTCFYIKLLSDHLKFGIELLSDMLINSKFSLEDINKEKEVILEEYNMYEDTPDELIHDYHLEACWDNHGLGRNILGTIDSISNFDKDMALNFYGEFYNPYNIVVAAAGNVNHDLFVEYVQAYLGNMKGKKVLNDNVKPTFRYANKIIVKDTEQIHVCIGTNGVPQDHNNIYTIHILNNILGGGVSSRLFQNIREDKGLAYSIYSYHSTYSDAGLFNIYTGTRPSNYAEVMNLIEITTNDIILNGVKEEEVKRTKDQLKANLLLGLESTSNIMSRLGKLEVSLNKHIPIEDVVKKVEAVTTADINYWAKKLFSQPKTTTTLGPSFGGE